MSESISEFFNLSPKVLEIDALCLADCEAEFRRIDEIKEYNQLKMLKAFTDCRVSANHLVGTTGYGYDDIGREKIEQVFAKLTGSEDALFRHNFMSGTHTLTVALFGVLRTGDTMLCATGTPYDTLCSVIGLTEGDANYGSLKDYGIKYAEVALKDGKPDLKGISTACVGKKICYIQRSRGYADRPSLSLED
ncbi:MAG: methionine gamma-lyase family protein, partial [Oscillospiraceae bacterium]